MIFDDNMGLELMWVKMHQCIRENQGGSGCIKVVGKIMGSKWVRVHQGQFRSGAPSY